MKNQNYLYVSIRVPKSASTSLENIIHDALPEARLFDMVGKVYGDGEYSIIEKIRAFRKERRRLWKNYGTFSPPAAWKKIENMAQSGDVVSGHFGIDEVVLGDFDLRRVTIVRHPAGRLENILLKVICLS